jgi:hypothetical protein
MNIVESIFLARVVFIYTSLMIEILAARFTGDLPVGIFFIVLFSSTLYYTVCLKNISPKFIR